MKKAKVWGAARQVFRGPAQVALALLLSCPAAQAADVYPSAFYGVGGTLVPLRGGQNIRLVSQDVRVSLPSRQVRARCVLRNDGPATTALVGLPERGLTDVLEDPPQGGFLHHLRSRVDGRRVSVRKIVPRTDEELATGAYRVLWVRRVAFARGQTRVLQDEWTSGGASMMQGGPESGFLQLFAFDLAGGSEWAGKIGQTRLQFDLTGLRGFDLVSLDNSGARRTANSATWRWRNWEPGPSQHTLGARWWPGVHNFQIDGADLLDRCVVVGKSHTIEGEFPAVYPVRRRGRVWVPLRLLMEWLPFAPDGGKNDIAQGAYRNARGLSWGRRNVSVETGKASLEYLDTTSNQWKRLPLSEPAFDERGATMVELAPAIQALGARLSVDAKTGTIRLFFKQVKN